ncbi:MAG: amidase, partial [Rhodospirillales bacterium]|nr:amidase [Rhodospirillales bacterium]
RAGATTAEAATEAYLDRIEILEPRLGAFECVMANQALDTARALDGLLAAGTDLGPLMGVPVAVKDLFAINGTPTTAGSNIDLSDIIGGEGTFIKILRRAGCVILGKTKTPEFAMGSVGGRGGVTHLRGTPWNPWDAEIQRSPGVSSSGSAVAVAGGLCAFAIGTDTGGSVRGPSAMCGIFGLKTTPGLWPADGMFPQAPALDTIGPMTATAADAALVFAALQGTALPRAHPLGGLRLAKPVNHFYEELAPPVEACVAAALETLANAGATIVPVEIPEIAEPKRDFGAYGPANLLAVLGRERFLAERHRMDPLIVPRIADGLEVKADHYIRLMWRRQELARLIGDRMEGFDGWVLPTAGMVAPPMSDVEGRDADDLRAEMATRKTHRRMAANFFGLCATSTPIQTFGSELPVGLQVMCPAGGDGGALSIALSLEGLFGAPPRPDLGGFL